MNGMNDENEDEDEEEIEALKAIIEIMKKVSFPAKERIVNYLMDRFELWDEE